MAAMVESKDFSSAVTVTVQAWPTATSLMSYSSTRKVTRRWAKSAICTSVSPADTASPSAKSSTFTRPSKPAVTVSPLASRSSLSSSFTSVPTGA